MKTKTFNLIRRILSLISIAILLGVIAIGADSTVRHEYQLPLVIVDSIAAVVLILCLPAWERVECVISAEDRLHYYKEMKELLLREKEYVGWGDHYGFCFLVQALIHLPKHEAIQFFVSWKYFPELIEYKPWYVITKDHVFYNPFSLRCISAYWFNPEDYERRIKILEKIINKMEEKK